MHKTCCNGLKQELLKRAFISKSLKPCGADIHMQLSKSCLKQAIYELNYSGTFAKGFYLLKVYFPSDNGALHTLFSCCLHKDPYMGRLVQNTTCS